MSETGEKIGWIGLGQIGTPMATRLLGNPGGLVVCDIVEEATRAFAEEGAEVASDPAGVVAAGATVISVMVRDDAQVRTVVAELVAVAPAGTLVAIHSTIRPETAEELAASAAEAGVVVLDAPVSGGVAGASTGRLALLLGGDADAVDRVRELYAPLADLVVHFGPAGAGTRAKIARNLVGFAGYVAVDEAMRLAEALGLDLRGLGQVIRHSDAVTGGAGAVALRTETGPLPEDHWLRSVFAHSAALGEKDLALALDLADEAGVDLPMAATARDRLAAALGVASEPASESRRVISLRFDMRLAGGDARVSYGAALDMVAWAEEPLAPFVVLSEHHGIEGGYLPSPGPMAAAMAARTTSTFFMVAATVLPLHDPVRLAEEICVIDHLSGGRVGWVFAVGYRPEEFALFGVEYADRGRLMDEKLAVLLDGLAELDPRPALFVGGGGARAARRAARFGLGLFAQTDVGGLGDLYAAACADAGIAPGPAVLPAPDLPLSVFVADDVDAAWDEIGPYLLANAIDYAAWNGGSTTTASLSTAATVEALRAEEGAYRIVTPDEARTMAAEGSLNLHPMCGGIPPEIAWPYLRRATAAV